MKSEILTCIAIFLMLGALIVGVAIYYKEEVNQCTSNPLSYGARQMEESYGYKFIGTGFFRSPIDIGTPIITFNSVNVSFQSNS